jgi:hypothetical protein
VLGIAALAVAATVVFSMALTDATKTTIVATKKKITIVPPPARVRLIDRFSALLDM